MNDFENPQVEKIIREGYTFRLSYYTKRGFGIARKSMWIFATSLFLFILIALLFSYLQEQHKSIALTSGLLFSYIVSPCCLAGFLWMMREADENREITIDGFLKGFNWLKEITIASITKGAIVLVILLPFIFLDHTNFENVICGDYNIYGHRLEGVQSLLMLLFIPIIYLFVAWSFTLFFIIFYDMKAWDAMEASRKIITPKWFVFLLFLILVIFISLFGVVMFGLGLLFTVPAGLAMIYAAFRDIVGMREKRKEDIIDHLISIDKV